MLTWLKTQAEERHKARDLYGAVVAQARQPRLFTQLGVPDTPEGRYEAIVLHAYLLLERLKAEGEAGRLLSQRLIETFVTDLDDAMREMGVGDLTVPKKVKKAAAGLYDRTAVYRAALAGADPAALAAALGQVLRDCGGDASRADPFAAYVRAVAGRLSAMPGSELLAGRLPLASADDPVTGGG